jgi:hypothetical protein
MALKQQPDTHKPIFKATPKKRAWHQRLTPAAWLVIVVGGVLAILLTVGLFGKLFGSRDTPFVLPPTVTPVVKMTPTSTPPKATATPEAWVWWADEMTCNGSECIAPTEVISDVVRAYWEWKEVLPYYHYELEMTPDELAQYYTGELLDIQLEFLALVEETGVMWDGQTMLTEYAYATYAPQVSSCTPDGLTCIVGETVRGEPTPYKYDLSTRQIVETTRLDDAFGGANIWQFKYDVEDSQWKIEKYLEWAPAP